MLNTEHKSTASITRHLTVSCNILDLLLEGPYINMSLTLPETIDRSSCEALQNVRDPRGLVALLGTSLDVREQVVKCVQRIVVPEGQGVSEDLVFLLPNLRYVQGPIIVSSIRRSGGVSRQIRGPLTLRVKEIRSDRREFSRALASLFLTRVSLYPSHRQEVFMESSSGEEDVLIYEPNSDGTYTLSIGGYSLQMDLDSLIHGARRINILSNVPLSHHLIDLITDSNATELGIGSSLNLRNILLSYMEKDSKRPPPLRSVFFSPSESITRSFSERFQYPYPIEFPGYVTQAMSPRNIERAFPALIPSTMGLIVRRIFYGDRKSERDTVVVSTDPLPIDSLTESELQLLRGWQKTVMKIQLVPYQVIRRDVRTHN